MAHQSWSQDIDPGIQTADVGTKAPPLTAKEMVGDALATCLAAAERCAKIAGEAEGTDLVLNYSQAAKTLSEAAYQLVSCRVAL